MVPVPKPNGDVTVCINYRQLNGVTKPNVTYMPTLEKILERGNSFVLTKLDLSKGYYQVRVAPESQAKTAFIRPFSKYEFLRMPFGLWNTPAIFKQ